MSSVLKYFNTEECKKLLDVKNNLKDPDIEIAGVKADAIVESALRPYATAVPLAGSELTEDIKYAANAKGAAIYALMIHNYDLEKSWNREFADAIARIIPALTAIPTNPVNQGIVYASSYRSEPLASRED